MDENSGSNREKQSKVLNYAFNKLSLLSKSLQQEKARLNLSNPSSNSNIIQNFSDINPNGQSNLNSNTFTPNNVIRNNGNQPQTNNGNYSFPDFSPQANQEATSQVDLNFVNNPSSSVIGTPCSVDFANLNFGNSHNINSQATNLNQQFNPAVNLNIVKEEIPNAQISDRMGDQMNYPVISTMEEAHQFVDADILLLNGEQEEEWRQMNHDINYEVHINTKTYFDFNDYLVLYSDQLIETFQRANELQKACTPEEKETKEVVPLTYDEWVTQVCNQYSKMDVFEQMAAVLESNQMVFGQFWLKWNQIIQVEDKFDPRLLKVSIFNKQRIQEKQNCFICQEGTEQSSHKVCITLCGHVMHKDCFDDFYLHRFSDNNLEPKCCCSRFISVFDVRFNQHLSLIRSEITLYNSEEEY